MESLDKSEPAGQVVGSRQTIGLRVGKLKGRCCAGSNAYASEKNVAQLFESIENQAELKTLSVLAISDR